MGFVSLYLIQYDYPEKLELGKQKFSSFSSLNSLKNFFIVGLFISIKHLKMSQFHFLDIITRC